MIVPNPQPLRSSRASRFPSPYPASLPPIPSLALIPTLSAEHIICQIHANSTHYLPSISSFIQHFDPEHRTLVNDTAVQTKQRLQERYLAKFLQVLHYVDLWILLHQDRVAND